MKATSQKECIFFVGGRGFNSVGSTKAGGCTKQWWDSQPNIDTDAGKSSAMAKLMGAGGQAIISGTFIVNSFDSIEKTITFEEDDSGDFDGVEVGMTLYGSNNVSYDVFDSDGVYEIIDRGSDWIKVKAGPHEDINVDDDADIVIAGAWSGIGEIMSYADASQYSQVVYINKQFVPLTPYNTSGWGGNLDRNSRLFIEGFHTVPGDMNVGGGYHQSALDAYGNGIDEARCVTVDCVNSGDGFIWDDSVNITFRNIYAKRPQGGKAGFALTASAAGDAVGCEFINCKSTKDDVNHNSIGIGGYFGFADSCSIKGFYSNNGANCVRVSGDNNSVDGCVLDPTTHGIVMHDHLEWPGSNTVRGNLIIGGDNGVVQGGHGIVENNTLVGQAVASLAANSDVGVPCVEMNNNILMPAEVAKAIGGFDGTADHKINLLGQNNLLWTTTGTPVSLESLINLHADCQMPDMSTWLFGNPQFADLAGGDFRCSNKNVLLGGLADAAGNETVIGAVGQRWQFVSRAKVSNRGRLSIIR